MNSDEPKRLWDEYSLIQSKIDKIGDFQFKVKGWSVAILSAVLYGGAKTSHLTIALISGLGIAFVFHIAEKRQRALSKALGERALDLEKAFLSFPPITNTRLWNAIIDITPQIRHCPAVARTLARTGLSGWWVSRSNDVFYWFQYVLLVLLLAVHTTGFSIQRLGITTDSTPRYELTVCGYSIIVYRSN